MTLHILLTGGAGYLGSVLCGRLLQAGYKVKVVDNLMYGQHTLRSGKKEFSGAIFPLRTCGGQRRYTAENIVVIRRIKAMRERGMSLSEIKRELTDDKEKKQEQANGIDLLTRGGALYLAQGYAGLSAKEMGKRLGGIEASGVSKAASRMEEEVGSDKNLSKLLRELDSSSRD